LRRRRRKNVFTIIHGSTTLPKYGKIMVVDRGTLIEFGPSIGAVVKQTSLLRDYPKTKTIIHDFIIFFLIIILLHYSVTTFLTVILLLS
jgi:hypothetical protein